MASVDAIVSFDHFYASYSVLVKSLPFSDFHVRPLAETGFAPASFVHLLFSGMQAQSVG